MKTYLHKGQQEKRSFGFDVYLLGKKIDTVFYSRDFLKGFKTLKEVKDYVRNSLINHDGYDNRIVL